MINLIRLQDPSLIEKYLTQDDLYKNVLGQLEYQAKPETATLLVFDNTNLIGVIVLHPFSETQIAIHGGIYKEFRGNGVEYLKQVVKQLKKILYPLHIVTTVTKTNIVAVKMTKQVFKLKKEILINNKQYLFFVE